MFWQNANITFITDSTPLWKHKMDYTFSWDVFPSEVCYCSCQSSDPIVVILTSMYIGPPLGFSGTGVYIVIFILLSWLN